MKYLILAPDYSRSCIKDEFSGEYLSYNDLSLNVSLITEIDFWHQQYRQIIPLNYKERMEIINIIDRLDQHGIILSEKIVNNSKENIKIKYFSEGRMQLLHII